MTPDQVELMNEDGKLPLPTAAAMTQPLHITELSRGLHWPQHRELLMLWAYFDEAGEHSGDGRLATLTLGGWMAPLAKWEAFEPEWRGALAEAGVEWFHAVDFAHFRGEFSGWSEDQRQELMARLVSVTARHIRRGFGFTTFASPDIASTYESG
jgi:hypothetical protein